MRVGEGNPTPPSFHLQDLARAKVLEAGLDLPAAAGDRTEIVRVETGGLVPEDTRYALT